MSKSIKDLDFNMQARAQKAYDQMNSDEALRDLGCNGGVAISETKRELTTQMAYYSRGRMDVADVKRMYAAAGLYQIGDEEAKTKNTWTLQSKHLQGKAIDLVPVKDGKLWWNAPENVWERMGEIGEENGLAWGGRWTQKDLPHFEI